MEKITKKELKEILERHKLWLDSNGKEGKCADLSNADLTSADLTGANLSYADLTGANLSYADLRCSNLTGSNFTGAYLYGASLTDANLSGADLTNANLRYANLRYANLTDAYLTGANLELSVLTDTILDEKEQCRKGITLTEQITGYKKSGEGKIITLEIPIGAKVFSINNDKRRTNKAKVIDMQGNPELSSMGDNDFKYHVGDEIEIKDFDERYNVECGCGIHFFSTREEVENYMLY